MASGQLTVTIRDNGTGAETIQEGIGMAGMREHLARLGGEIGARNVPGGFELRMSVRVEKLGSYDAVVAGGGPAGFAAALAARRIERFYLAGKSGLGYVEAGVFVDCTGDTDVAQRAGFAAAAALCAREGLAPTDVDVAALRRHLTECGAILS